MTDIFRQLIKPRYETLNRVEIKRQAILDNYQVLKKKQPQAAIFPVLKSNAYGHGLKEISSILNQTDAPLVAVDSFPEAQVVKKYFKRQILILSRMTPEAYRYTKGRRYEFCVADREILEALPSGSKIHLFVNTGMNREGIKNLSNFLDANKELLRRHQVVGFCSHLASADTNDDLNTKQLKKFLADLDTLKSFGYTPKWVHLGNSAGVFSLSDTRLTAFRSGLALYGYNPLNQSHPAYLEAHTVLQPALELYSKVVAIQNLESGEVVSYNARYQASKATKIVVVPFGYYEGLPRSLPATTTFFFKQTPLTLAGSVCMNLTCLDANTTSLKLGDEVQLISSNPKASNSLHQLASVAGLIDYEFLTGLKANIRHLIT